MINSQNGVDEAIAAEDGINNAPNGHTPDENNADASVAATRPHNSKLTKARKWSARQIAYSLFALKALFKPSIFYATTSQISVKKSWARLAQALFMLFAFMAVAVHPASPILLLAIIITMTPFFFICSVVDPFMSWMRGLDNRPFRTIYRYLSQATWALLITMTPFLIASVVLIHFFPGIFDAIEANPQSQASGLMFVAFMIIFTFHYLISQREIPNVNQSHRIVSAIIFVGSFIISPAVHHFIIM